MSLNYTVVLFDNQDKLRIRTGRSYGAIYSIEFYCATNRPPLTGLHGIFSIP
uniref:Uncharacterized protein n=1 Tax=Kuenenia stuttgartiensis TaxID=174633 RepID=Q1PXB7_KUEST|nr:unknown protein [Candidatus Kuenenia stuttgartiensis]